MNKTMFLYNVLSFSSITNRLGTLLFFFSRGFNIPTLQIPTFQYSNLSSKCSAGEQTISTGRWPIPKTSARCSAFHRYLRQGRSPVEILCLLIHILLESGPYQQIAIIYYSDIAAFHHSIFHRLWFRRSFVCMEIIMPCRNVDANIESPLDSGPYQKNIGILEYWIMECWNIGIWNNGILE